MIVSNSLVFLFCYVFFCSLFHYSINWTRPISCCCFVVFVVHFFSYFLKFFDFDFCCFFRLLPINFVCLQQKMGCRLICSVHARCSSITCPVFFLVFFCVSFSVLLQCTPPLLQFNLFVKNRGGPATGCVQGIDKHSYANASLRNRKFVFSTINAPEVVLLWILLYGCFFISIFEILSLCCQNKVGSLICFVKRL